MNSFDVFVIKGFTVENFCFQQMVHSRELLSEEKNCFILNTISYIDNSILVYIIESSEEESKLLYLEGRERLL